MELVAVFRVLFVCIGNVCRSPLGERLLAARLPVDRFEVSSAGVGAMVGSPISPEAAIHLEPYAVSAADFEARQLTSTMVQDSGLVLTATRAIRGRVLEETPGALRRTFTVLEFAALLDVIDPHQSPESLARAAAEERSRAALDDYDIADPYGRGADANRLAARQMATAVERIAKGLAP